MRLQGNTISDVATNLINKLRQEEMGFVDYVFIEQQVNRNIQMKVLSHVIQTYFMCEAKMPSDSIQFVSPKNRFSTNNIKYNQIVNTCRERLGLDQGNVSRKAYKDLSVLVCRQTLQNEWLPYFESAEKKDDLADSFLQFYAWFVSTVDRPDIIIP